MQLSSTTASSERSEAPPGSGTVVTLGKYRLVRRIARGGMGEVHLAKLPGELGFEKLLVVKTIRAELAADPRFVELFAAEAKTAVALSHPNITPIYELGRAEDGSLYTAMGWVDGPSLAQLGERLRRDGRTLELAAVLFIGRELLDGLAHAHSRDHGRPPVVHRDISPRNVLIDRSGRVQIVDFGIARPADSEVRGMMGSAGYMAPEQARSEVVDPRADVFSVGCVLYELLTGERAFPKEGVWMLPELAALPDELRSLLARALALDPSERFADAGEFLRALAPALSEHAPAFASRDLAAILRPLFPEGWSVDEEPRRSDAITPATKPGLGPPAQTIAFATRVTPAMAPEPVPMPLEDRLPTLEQPAEAGADDEQARTEELVLAQPVERRHGSPLIWALAGAGAAALVGVAASVVLFGAGHRADDPVTLAEPEPEPEPVAVAAQPRTGPRTSEQAEAPPVIAKPERIHEQPPPAQPALAPASEVELHVSPAGAEVLVDGEALTGPPFLIELAEQPRELELRLAGHHSLRTELEPSETGELRFELEPLGEGTLTVLAPTVAWAEVRLDGKLLGTTPLSDKPVLEGRHKLEIHCSAAVCGEAKLLLRKSIHVRAGRATKVQTP